MGVSCKEALTRTLDLWVAVATIMVGPVVTPTAVMLPAASPAPVVWWRCTTTWMSRCSMHWTRRMKRTLDILFSAMALLVLSPLLLLVAILLRCTGEGCVLYRQERIGMGGGTFYLYKFVTMRKGSDSSPAGFLTASNDHRVLPFGRILRATKINELPQLYNVLLGDMSFIGPRPQVRPHFDVYADQVKKEIIKVRPGLSGIASIVFRDEGSLLAKCGRDKGQCYAEDIAPYKGELEVWYVQHQSLMLDASLVFLTALVVLLPRTGRCIQLFGDLPQPASVLLSASLASSQADPRAIHHASSTEGSWRSRMYRMAAISSKSQKVFRGPV